MTGSRDKRAGESDAATFNYVSNLIPLAWVSPAPVNRVLEGDDEATVLATEAIHSRKVSTWWRGQL